MSAINYKTNGLLFLILISFFLTLFSVENHAEKKNYKLLKEKSFQVNPGMMLVLESDGGDVEVTTWDKNSVHVKIFGNSKAEKMFSFEFDSNEKRVYIQGKKHGRSIFNWFSSASLKYEITVPYNFNTQISTSGGDVNVLSLEGELSINTSGGDIYLKNSGGMLEARTSGGDIKLNYFDGEMKLATSGGDIDANHSTGNIEARTSGGDISLGIKSGKISARTSGGDISLSYKGKNKGIELYSSGGDINVKVPQNFSADTEIKSTGGDIILKFPGITLHKISNQYYTGKINSGTEPFILKTIGGDVLITGK
ncbi:hypothetical protein BMS3Abin04_02372 [bacterium BMS3Abin04]|nr:hypothetical protein BMS3Abin04_02372 [bacterium BMS3Abin04]